MVQYDRGDLIERGAGEPPSSCFGREDLFLGRYDLRHIFPLRVDVRQDCYFCLWDWKTESAPDSCLALDEGFTRRRAPDSAADSNMFGARLQRAEIYYISGGSRLRPDITTISIGAKRLRFDALAITSCSCKS